MASSDSTHRDAALSIQVSGSDYNFVSVMSSQITSNTHFRFYHRYKTFISMILLTQCKGSASTLAISGGEARVVRSSVRKQSTHSHTSEASVTASDESSV